MRPLSGAASTTACLRPVAAFLADGPSYLHLSDIHLGGTDTTPAELQRALGKVKEVLALPNPPAFVLFTGDLAAHNVTGADKVTADRDALNALANAVGAATPLLYLPGNNDPLAGDYASFTDHDDHVGAGTTSETPLSTAPGRGLPYVNIAAACSATVGAPCITSPVDPADGYYSVRPIDGLRVIAMNTVLFTSHEYYDHNTKGVARAAAAAAQLAWLEHELTSLGPTEKALIAMHIPPGGDAYNLANHKGAEAMWCSTYGWQDSFLEAVLAQPSVVGIAHGHTHDDDLRRIHRGDDQSPVAVIAIGAPGIVADHSNTPAFKVVSFDAASKAPVNAITLYADDQAVWGAGCHDLRRTLACASSQPTLLACLAPMATADVATAVAKLYYTGRAEPADSAEVARAIAVVAPQKAAVDCKTADGHRH